MAVTYVSNRVTWDNLKKVLDLVSGDLTATQISRIMGGADPSQVSNMLRALAEAGEIIRFKMSTGPSYYYRSKVQKYYWQCDPNWEKRKNLNKST